MLYKEMNFITPGKSFRPVGDLPIIGLSISILIQTNMDSHLISEEDFAGTLIISCSCLASDDLAKMILESNELPKPRHIHDKVKAYPWNIQTKYYSANAYLFVTEEKNLISANFAEGVQAVVICYDATSGNSFEDAKAWQTFVEHFSPEVKILTCKNFSEVKPEDEKFLSKSKVLDWCLKNQYELVELYPEELIEDDDAEDDFKETTGIKRVIQALHAVMWPSMELKENPTIKASERLERLLQEQDETLSSEIGNMNLNEPCQNIEGGQNQASISIDTLVDEDRAVFEALESEDLESFENLFGRFQDMKEKAKNLQGEDRKQYAEKVAIAFWKAMGGDEDEIAGLSDSSN